jgi:hypothetical protein
MSHAVVEASGEGTATQDDLTHIHEKIRDLVAASKGAASQMVSLGALTEPLGASSGIKSAMTEADAGR